MVDSMASALHYLGARQQASEVKQMGNRFKNKHNSFSLFLKNLQKKHKHLTPRREQPSTFDLLESKPASLVMSCIRGADGKEDHCICVYNKYIFDSNFDNALALTRDALNVCCSSSEKGTVYEGCTEVATFPDIFNLKK